MASGTCDRWVVWIFKSKYNVYKSSKLPCGWINTIIYTFVFYSTSFKNTLLWYLCWIPNTLDTNSLFAEYICELQMVVYLMQSNKVCLQVWIDNEQRTQQACAVVWAGNDRGNTLISFIWKCYVNCGVPEAVLNSLLSQIE